MLLADLGVDYNANVDYQCDATSGSMLCQGLNEDARDAFYSLQDALNAAAQALSLPSRISSDGIIGPQTVALAAQILSNAPSSVADMYAVDPTAMGLAANATTFVRAAQTLAAGGGGASPPSASPPPAASTSVAPAGKIPGTLLWMLLGSSLLITAGALLFRRQKFTLASRRTGGGSRAAPRSERSRAASRRRTRSRSRSRRRR